jgi:hypothetical protein
MDRYRTLLHAMQTGVKFDQENGSTDGTPKHLRVGVNSAMVSDAALVKLLVEKGVFTNQEFADKLVEAAQAEVDRYTAKLAKLYGVNVHLS